MSERITLKLITSNDANQSVVLARQPFGDGARIRLNLDVKDTDEHQYFIELPEHTYAITSSFLRGLLGPSAAKLTREQFDEKYMLDCPHQNRHLDSIHMEIDEWKDRTYDTFRIFNKKS